MTWCPIRCHIMSQNVTLYYTGCEILWHLGGATQDPPDALVMRVWGDFRRCLLSVTCHIMSHCITYLGLLCEPIFGNSGNWPEAVIIRVWGFWEVRRFPLDVTKPHKISHIFDFLSESGYVRIKNYRDALAASAWPKIVFFGAFCLSR